MGLGVRVGVRVGVTVGVRVRAGVRARVSGVGSTMARRRGRAPSASAVVAVAWARTAPKDSPTKCGRLRPDACTSEPACLAASCARETGRSSWLGLGLGLG